MTTYKQLRDAVADTLDDALLGVQVYPTPGETAQLPAAVVSTITRDGTESGDYQKRVRVDVLLIVSRRHVDQWQILDQLCEPTGSLSVQAALELDGTLGGVVSDLRVVNVEQVGDVPVDGEAQFGAICTLEVWL